MKEFSHIKLRIRICAAVKVFFSLMTLNQQNERILQEVNKHAQVHDMSTFLFFYILEGRSYQ